MLNLLHSNKTLLLQSTVGSSLPLLSVHWISCSSVRQSIGLSDTKAKADSTVIAVQPMQAVRKDRLWAT